MSNKELKYLKRSELIEIIYQLKKNEETLISENEELRKKLSEREIKVERAGSLAEAALALSGIFTAAEESVALYVEEIERRYKRMQEEEKAAAQRKETKKANKQVKSSLANNKKKNQLGKRKK